MEGEIKQRGGYAGDLRHQIKVRVSLETLTALRNLSDKRLRTVAFLIRGFITKGLAEQWQ
jgi:predicted DNA-binding protein